MKANDTPAILMTIAVVIVIGFGSYHIAEFIVELLETIGIVDGNFK